MGGDDYSVLESIPFTSTKTYFLFIDGARHKRRGKMRNRDGGSNYNLQKAQASVLKSSSLDRRLCPLWNKEECREDEFICQSSCLLLTSCFLVSFTTDTVKIKSFC